MLNQDFKEFLRLLNDNHARYLVVGGYAVALHGHPRYSPRITRDTHYDRLILFYNTVDRHEVYCEEDKIDGYSTEPDQTA